MKILAIGWYAMMLAVVVTNCFGIAPKYLVCLALGTLGYHSYREIKNWWQL